MSNNSVEILYLGYTNLEIKRKKVNGEKKEDHKDLILRAIVDYRESVDEDNIYIVNLTCIGDKENEFDFKVKVSGIFRILSEEEAVKMSMLKYDTVGILYPYIRSAVTLLTSQPGMKPITLKPVIIKEFVDNFVDVEEEKDDKEE